MRRIAIMVVVAGAWALVACGQDRSSSEQPGDGAQEGPTVGNRDGGRDAGPGVALDAGSVVPPKPPAKDELYDDTRVIEFHLGFAPDQWQQLLAYRAQMVSEYVHCSFRYGLERFEDAACRNKGSIEDWEVEPKMQFVVKFNHWNKEGRFRGLRGLNLEASHYHSAPIRDRLGMWMMRQAGIPASRVNSVRVYLDGSYYGLYQNIEIVDHEFLEDHFRNPDGNLYKEGWELKTNEAVPDLTRLNALDALIAAEPLTGDHAAFYASLATLMDVGQVVDEMAAEAVMPTPDNYSNGGANFYLYDEPGHAFVVIPWDMDMVFDSYTSPTSDPFEYWGDPSLQSPPNKLRQLLNQHPTYRKAFEDKLVALRDGPLSRMPALVDSYCAQVRTDFAQDPNKPTELSEFDLDCADMKARIVARIEFLKKVLGR